MQDSSSRRCNRLPPVRRDAPARRIRSRSSARLKQSAVQVEHLAMDAEGPLAELQGVEEAPLPEVVGVGQDRNAASPGASGPGRGGVPGHRRSEGGIGIQEDQDLTARLCRAPVLGRPHAALRLPHQAQARRRRGRGLPAPRQLQHDLGRGVSRRSAGYCCMATDPMAPAMQACSLRAGMTTETSGDGCRAGGAGAGSRPSALESSWLAVTSSRPEARASRDPPPLRPPPPMAIIPTASRRRACRAHHQHQESPTA